MVTTRRYRRGLKISWRKREVQTRELRSLKHSKCEATSKRSSLGSVNSEDLLLTLSVAAASRELLLGMPRLI
jgi:hypothetical protein